MDDLISQHMRSGSTWNTSALGSRIFLAGLGLICGVQGVALVTTMSRGWYYNDDFALLMNASHRGLSWSYLKSPINDHLLPGLRLEYWILRHVAPLSHGPTIVVRLLLQEIATVLLAYLLSVLLGARRRVLLVVGLYAMCPLVITNCLWLVVALSVLPAQALVLVSLIAHVRFVAGGRVRWAALSGLCLLGSALFWEKAATLALLLPLVSLIYVYQGSVLGRLRSCLRQWLGWVVTIVPPPAFALFFVLQGYGGATKPVAVGNIANVVWLQWSRVIAPSIFGGPWRWFYFPGVSLGYAQVTRTELVLTQLGFLLLVLAGVRLAGWKSLLAWLIPLIPFVIGTAIVSLGRYQSFGTLIAIILRYSSDLAMPLFLGLGLAIVRSDSTAVRQRALARISLPTKHNSAHDVATGRSTGPLRRRPALGGAVAVMLIAWLAGSTASLSEFSRHWSADPTHNYVTTLRTSIDAAGPSLNLYDTTVSQKALPIFFGPHWHMSDFLPLSGRVPTLDGPGSEPLLADDSGHLVPAAFVPAVTRGPPTGGLCTYLIQGAGTFKVPFTTPAPVGDGFLRIDYLQPRPSTAEVMVIDTDGHELKPTEGADVLFGNLLSHVTLRLPITSVAAVVFRTGAPDTHLCIGHLTVGAPFPAGGSR